MMFGHLDPANNFAVSSTPMHLTWILLMDGHTLPPIFSWMF